MTIKKLSEINDLIHELYDFFISNADGDETGLFQEMSLKNENVKEIIKSEFFRLHLRNELSKLRRHKK